MKAGAEHIDPEELLVKYITGEATAEEKLRVEEWISADTSNRQHYEHFKQIWEQSSNLENENFVDENQAWERFKQRTENVIPLARRNDRWLKIAAAVVIGFGAMLFVKYVLSSKDDARFATVTTKPNPPIVSAKQDTVITLGANKVTQDTMTDGTIITTNRNSTIRYPKTFRGKTRNIELTGEAFFNVKHDAKKPFVIKVNNVQITVLGTSFNVKEKGNNTEVIVETGRVSVQCQQRLATISAGQKITVTGISGAFKITPVIDKSYRSYFDAKVKLPGKADVVLDSARKDVVKRDSIK